MDREQMKKAYQHVFSGSQGEIVLKDLRKESGIHEFVEVNNALTMSEKIGRRNLMLYIENKLNVREE